MDQFISALHWRHAVKEFSEKKVPQQEIDHLMEAARLAPSSFNIQPWKIILVQDKALLQELLPVSYNQPQVATTQDMFVFCANTDLGDAFDKVIESMKAQGATDDQLKIYVDMVRGFIASLSPTQQSEFAQRQLYIALGVMLSAAALRKIDTAPMEGLDRQGVARVLGLPKHLIPFAHVAVGYRKEDPTRPKSRLQKEIMYDIR